MRDADPEKAKSGAGRFPAEQGAGGGEYPIGEQGWIFERGVARPDLELRGLELEDDRTSRQTLLLRPPRHPFAHIPKNSREVGIVGDVVIEGRLGADALAHFASLHVANILATG